MADDPGEDGVIPLPLDRTANVEAPHRPLRRSRDVLPTTEEERRQKWCDHTWLDVDDNERIVHCRACKARLDPVEAIYCLGRFYDRLHHEVNLVRQYRAEQKAEREEKQARRDARDWLRWCAEQRATVRWTDTGVRVRLPNGRERHAGTLGEAIRGLL